MALVVDRLKQYKEDSFGPKYLAMLIIVVVPAADHRVLLMRVSTARVCHLFDLLAFRVFQDTPKCTECRYYKEVERVNEGLRIGLAEAVILL